MVMISIRFNYIFKEPTSKQLLSEVLGVKISTCELGVSQILIDEINKMWSAVNWKEFSFKGERDSDPPMTLGDP